MHEECKNKCEFKLRTLFINSKYDENTKIFKNMCRNKDYEKFIIESKNLILSIDGKNPLKKLTFQILINICQKLIN